MAQHPMIHATPETHYLDCSANGNWWHKRKALRSNEAFVTFTLERNSRLLDMPIGKDGVELALRSGYPSFADAFQKILAAEAERSKLPIIVEKTPRHLEFLDQITTWFADAKIVIIVRDGRDAVESLCKVEWGHSNPVRHAGQWRENVRTALASKRKWPDRVHLIRYEDLLVDPRVELDSICDFIGVKFDPEMITGDDKTSAIPDWEQSWKANSGDKIDPSLTQKWRKSTNRALLSKIESMIAPELNALGYVCSNDRQKLGLFDKISINFSRFRYRASVFYRKHMYPNVLSAISNSIVQKKTDSRSR